MLFRLFLTASCATACALAAAAPATAEDGLEAWRGAPPAAWSEMLVRREKEEADTSACGPFHTCMRPHWRSTIDSLRSLRRRAQIAAVNRWLNARPYAPDAAGRDDWATPEQFLAEGGDCEDFAVAKYFALRALGFSADELEIAILREASASDHAVLIVGRGRNRVVLDNRHADPMPLSAYRSSAHIRMVVSEAGVRVRERERSSRPIASRRTFSIAQGAALIAAG